MTDAISRSAVLPALVNHNDGYLMYCDWHDSVKECQSAIDSIPALDVAPVVHARWIVKRMAGNIIALQCSSCENYDNPSKVRGNFCWNCGARMDGEENEAD